MGIVNGFSGGKIRDIGGTWQTDEHGRRFRRFGNSVEYATDLVAAGRYSPEGLHQEADLSEYLPICPFSSGMNNKCKRDCSFFGGRSCVLAMNDSSEDRETLGNICPFGKTRKKCADSCALYNDGCGFIKLIRALNTAGKCGENEGKA